MASSILSSLLIESRMHDALEGDPCACFDMGIALSAGTPSRANLIEAHKWFDLAVEAGYAPAASCRNAIAERLNHRDCAEARRRSRGAHVAQGRQLARITAAFFA